MADNALEARSVMTPAPVGPLCSSPLSSAPAPARPVTPSFAPSSGSEPTLLGTLRGLPVLHLEGEMAVIRLTLDKFLQNCFIFIISGDI